MLFGFQKFAKKEFEKIKESFTRRDEKIKDLVSKKEVELMIKEAILNLKETNLKVCEVSPQTPRTTLRKRADKFLDKAEICQEIASMLQKGLSTTEAYNQIVVLNKSCKKTCFYKYLKKVREQLAQTPRTESNQINFEERSK